MDDDPMITAAEALATIGADSLERLAECQRRGWAEWTEIRATRAGAPLSTSARARIVYDGTVHRAREIFDPVMCGMRHGLLVLDFGRVMVRFKKLDEDLIPRGIPTGQAVMFEDQSHLDGSQMTLWAPAPMLILGYVLDDLGTAIGRQVLILRRRGAVIWEHDVRSENDGLSGIVPGPTPSVPPVPAEVRPRRDEEAAEEAR